MTVEGKIMKKYATTTVGQKKLNLSNSIFVDKTATISVDLWESHIEKVEVGNSYVLIPYKSMPGQEEKPLKTMRNLIKPIKDEQLDILNPLKAKPNTNQQPEAILDINTKMYFHNLRTLMLYNFSLVAILALNNN